MKYLYLLRHADASIGAKGTKDHDRPLSQSGIEQCIQLAAYLHQNAFRFDRVLCSTALRVQQTCSELMKALDSQWNIAEDKSLYLCDSHQLMEEIYLMDDDINHLLIIGHNPTLQEASWQLCGKNHPDQLQTIEQGFPPTTFVSLSICIENWAAVRHNKIEHVDVFKVK